MEISKRGLTLLVFIVIILSLFSTYVLFNEVVSVNSKLQAIQHEQQFESGSGRVGEASPTTAYGILKAQVIRRDSGE